VTPGYEEPAVVAGPDCGRGSVEIHRRIGNLPGDLVLYPKLTGRQHIAWYASARGLRDLSFATELAGRLDAVLDRPARELSKGNRPGWMRMTCRRDLVHTAVRYGVPQCRRHVLRDAGAAP
jgi:ABC-type multidrug transport system ATPase subunit